MGRVEEFVWLSIARGSDRSIVTRGESARIPTGGLVSFRAATNQVATASRGYAPWRPVMTDLTRRRFLGTSAGFVTAATLATAAKLGSAAQGDPLNIAVIGPGGMGMNHVRLLAARKDVKITYVCDVDANRLAAAAKHVEQSGGSPKPVKDLRQVLDDKSVEAVWIATPDHWHSPAAILAASAGKHVYVEKPV